VPTISAFYGIVIRMFVKDHPPHLLDGELPPRAARLVREWASLHRPELEANWGRAKRMEPVQPIEPLP
jgi:hypothetical protein